MYSLTHPPPRARAAQDLVDMWGGLRSQNPKNDLINKPGSTDESRG